MSVTISVNQNSPFNLTSVHCFEFGPKWLISEGITFQRYLLVIDPTVYVP